MRTACFLPRPAPHPPDSPSAVSSPDTPSRSASFRWPPQPEKEAETLSEGFSRPSQEELSAGALAERLEIAEKDQVSTSLQLVREVAKEVHAWLGNAPAEPDSAKLGRQLEAGLAGWAQVHGYRGGCARFLDAIRRAYWFGIETSESRLSELLQEELGLWTWTTPQLLGTTEWNGEPLAPGSRVCLEGDVSQHAAALLGTDHVVCVHGGSELIADALEYAREEGKRPYAYVSEGGPDGAGRRMASRLAQAGVAVTFCYDHALPEMIENADRVWIGSEAVGAESALARVGTSRLCEAAREHEIPIEVLATADDLVPGGELELPTWCLDESWLLWEYAPQGIRLETQLFEKVSFDLIDAFLTDAGRERPAQFHLRALRTTMSRPCDA